MLTRFEIYYPQENFWKEKYILVPGQKDGFTTYLNPHYPRKMEFSCNKERDVTEIKLDNPNADPGMIILKRGDPLTIWVKLEQDGPEGMLRVSHD